MGNVTGPLGALGVVVPLGAETWPKTLLLHTPFRPQPFRRGRPPAVGGPAPQDENLSRWLVLVAPGPRLGLLDLLTWQSRRIRLIPEVNSDGRVVVRRTVLAAGDRPFRRPALRGRTRRGSTRRRSSNQVPVRHVAGRAGPGRGLEPLLAVGDDPARRDDQHGPAAADRRPASRGMACQPTCPFRSLTAGVEYGNQSSVVVDVIADQIPFPITALNPAGARGAGCSAKSPGQADDLRIAANRLGDDLRQAAGERENPSGNQAGGKTRQGNRASGPETRSCTSSPQ